MVSTSLFYPFAFSYLSAIAIASPLAPPSSPQLLDLANSTSNVYSFNVAPQVNITVPASDVWPQPPVPNPFRYRVPNTNVAVEFSQQRYPPGGLNQQDVLRVLNMAFFDCAAMPPGQELPLNPKDWTSWQVRLEMTPRNVRPGSRDPKLTYGVWCTALEAIQGFVEHYHGRDVLFNVFGDDQNHSLALGRLWKMVRPPTESG